MGGKYIFNSAHTVPERKLILHKMVASLDLVMRTTVCYRKTEITMRASAILIDLPCYSVLETGKKKKWGGGWKAPEQKKPHKPPWLAETFTTLVAACRSKEQMKICQENHPLLNAEMLYSLCHQTLLLCSPTLHHPAFLCILVTEKPSPLLCHSQQTRKHACVCGHWHVYTHIFALSEHSLFFFPAEITWLLNSHWDFFIHFCFAAARA